MSGTKPIDRDAWPLFAACLLMLAWKGWMIWRLNVNWDEFFFLSHVHAMLRGDLDIAFQTIHTHLFIWLPWLSDFELPQIYAARLVMLGLLLLSIVQIARLASRWVSPGAAWVASIAFLCLMTTLRHGASFRSDSMLLPILLGATLLLTRPQPSGRSDVWAGALCGLGVAINIKLALFAPMLAACAWFGAPPRDAVKRLLVVGGATLLTASVLLGLNRLALQVPPAETVDAFAGRTFGKSLGESGFLPGAVYVRRLFAEDSVLWLLTAAGLVLALWRRRWQLAALSLSLLPVLFYRNAFPYFYVVMFGPAVVLIGFLVEEGRRLLGRSSPAWQRGFPLACGGVVLLIASVRLPLMTYDEQQGQRAVLNAVHEIFPEPVPYMDHSGMVSTFPKVNFFMSTWGMDDYRQRGRPFVARALRDHQPPMLIANRAFLDPRAAVENGLLPEDRELIANFYQPYWGPIFVAGGNASLGAGEIRELDLPFSGSYRVQTDLPVKIDGVVRKDGDVVVVADGSVELSRSDAEADGVQIVRLLWAGARPPPDRPPVFNYIYTLL